MISDYTEHLRERGYSANTVDISNRWLQHFFSRYPGPVKDLKPADLTRYHKSLHWEPGPGGEFHDNAPARARFSLAGRSPDPAGSSTPTLHPARARFSLAGR